MHMLLIMQGDVCCLWIMQEGSIVDREYVCSSIRVCARIMSAVGSV